MLLLLLMVWVAQGAELTPEGYVPRLNLGVVFIEETTPLVVGTELLDLTIILPYHIRSPIETYFNQTLEKLRSSFNFVRTQDLSYNMAFQIDSLQREAYQRAYNVFSDLRQTLAAPIETAVARQKCQAIQYFTGIGGGGGLLGFSNTRKFGKGLSPYHGNGQDP